MRSPNTCPHGWRAPESKKPLPQNPSDGYKIEGNQTAGKVARRFAEAISESFNIPNQGSKIQRNRPKNRFRNETPAGARRGNWDMAQREGICGWLRDNKPGTSTSRHR